MVLIMDIKVANKFILGDTPEEIQLRPSGKKVTLGEIYAKEPQLFAQLLGTAPFKEAKNLFVSLAQHHLDMGDYELGKCKVHQDLRINLEICKWCQNFQECALLENISDKITISINRYGASNDSMDEVLKTYFLNNLKEDSIIFCDEGDPFYPQSRDKVTKTLRLFNPSEYEIPFTDGKQCWHHLFYSPLLKRTLCIFEAEIIEQMDNNLGTRKMSKRYAFPTGNDVKSFLSDYNISKLKDLDKFDKGKLIFINEKISSWMNYVGKYLPTGLYEPTVELFRNYSEEKTIEENLFDYIVEIISALDMAEEKLLECQSVVGRKSCILYVPGGYERIMGISFSHQITRIVELDGLEEVLVLVDTEIEPVKRIEENYSQFLTKEFWNKTSTIPDSLQFLFENSQYSAKIIDWHHINRSHIEVESKRPEDVYTAWFPPQEYFSALSYHQYLRQTIASSGDKEYYLMRKNLSLFFEYFYPEDETDLALESFRTAYNEPKNRRLLGYDIMLLLSDSKFEPYLSYYTDTDHSTNTTIERFIFTSSTLKNINSQKLKWTFERTRTEIKSNEGLEKNLTQKLFFTFTESGKTDDLNLLGLGQKLANAISWKPNQKYIITAKGGGIWLSAKILQLLEREFLNNNFVLGHFIAAKHNNYSFGRVMCISLHDELEYVKSITGENTVSRSIEQLDFEINEVKHQLCIWNPETAASESSPSTFMKGK